LLKQLFPEACYPHTHTSLKIAALSLPVHSVLSKAQFAQFCLSVFFLVNKELGYSLWLITSYFQNTSTMASSGIHKCDRCKSGKQQTLSMLAFLDSVGSSSIKGIVLLP
jgi:hypothetical protein